MIQTTLSAEFQRKAHALYALGVTPEQFAIIVSELAQARTQLDTATPLASVLARYNLGHYAGSPPTLHLTPQGRLFFELTTSTR